MCYKCEEDYAKACKKRHPTPCPDCHAESPPPHFANCRFDAKERERRGR